MQDAELPGKESVRMEIDVQIYSKSQLEIEKLECLLSSWSSRGFCLFMLFLFVCFGVVALLCFGTRSFCAVHG